MKNLCVKSGSVNKLQTKARQAGCAALLWLCTASAVLAEANPTHTAITNAVHDFLTAKAEQLAAQDQGQLDYKLTGLDPRLSLKPCEQAINVTTSRDNWLTKRGHLNINCPQPQWSMLIGVELSLMRNVLVARVPIDRNQPLENLTEFASRDILAIHSGYIDNEDAVLSKVTKRQIVMGQVISPNMMKAEILVPRNSIVEVSAQIGQISVTSQGVALENGAFGDIIQVRNKRSKRIIEARVVQANKVEVNL